jgi:hypothetical protein
MGIEITGGSHDRIAGCTLSNLGTLAVSVTGGSDHTIVSCDISHCGEGGIILAGGDRKTLTPGRHAVINNDLSDFSRWVRTYRPAVALEGVGHRVAHNLFRDAPHCGVLLHGNEHVIEYNEFRNILQETGDAGAFYMGRDLTERGNIVRYNFFHDNGPSRDADINSIYLDDFASGTTVLGNVCWHSGRGVMIGGGRDNTVVNNVFVDERVGIHVDARGLGWAKTYYDGTDQTLFDRLKAVSYDRPPFSVRYPKLVNVLKDEPAVPKGNVIARNICIGGKFIDWLDGMNDKIVRVENNFTEGDAGFVDPQNGDFRLKPDAAPRKLGIESVPMNEMGLQPDEYRKK